MPREYPALRSSTVLSDVSVEYSPSGDSRQRPAESSRSSIRGRSPMIGSWRPTSGTTSRTIPERARLSHRRWRGRSYLRRHVAEDQRVTEDARTELGGPPGDKGRTQSRKGSSSVADDPVHAFPRNQPERSTTHCTERVRGALTSPRLLSDVETRCGVPPGTNSLEYDLGLPRGLSAGGRRIGQWRHLLHHRVTRRGLSTPGRARRPKTGRYGRSADSCAAMTITKRRRLGFWLTARMNRR